jgi:type I restriction enzyme S subunit
MKLGDHTYLGKNKVDPEGLDPEIKYIGLEHIGEGTLSLNGFGFASDVNSSKAVFEKGDILFGKLRPYFRKVIIAPFDGICSTDIWVVKPKNGIDRNFLFYWMASQDFVDEVTRSSEGTRMPRAKWKVASKIEIPDVDIKTQKEIGEILYTLDQKIHLNQQTNETLEAMAQAMFKSWFVDFDPVRAKIEANAEGHDPNRAAMAAIAGVSLEQDWDAIEAALQQKLDRMSDTQRTQLRHTAELFPDELVESEIGEVPKGWGVSEIGKEVNSVGGTTPRTKNPKYWDGGKIAWTTPKDLSNANSKILLETDRKITDEGLDQISSGLLPINTVLMSSRAPVGYLALSKIPVAINQGYVAMICDQILTPEYVLHWTESNMDIIKQHAGGSTFAEISKRDFRPLPVLVPNKEVLNAYSDKAGSLYDLITANMNENKTLENIRDTLLPRLISGEIQI